MHFLSKFRVSLKSPLRSQDSYEEDTEKKHVNDDKNSEILRLNQSTLRCAFDRNAAARLIFEE